MLTSSLFAAGLWGATDACGGISSRRSTPLLSAVFLHLTSLLLLAPFVFLGKPAIAITSSAIVYGIGAGILAAVGDVLFGRASTTSTMTVGIPLINVIGAAIPATVPALQGDSVTLLGVIGMIGALAAAVMAALPSNGHVAIRGAGYAIAAGVCFGGMYGLLTQVPSASSVAVVFVMRLAGTLALAPGVLARYQGWTFPLIRSGLMSGVLSGVASVLANCLFVYAMSSGDRVTHSVVAIGLSAPAGVLIAYLYQRESVKIAQVVSTALALCSIVILAANQAAMH